MYCASCLYYQHSRLWGRWLQMLRPVLSINTYQKHIKTEICSFLKQNIYYFYMAIAPHWWGELYNVCVHFSFGALFIIPHFWNVSKSATLSQFLEPLNIFLHLQLLEWQYQLSDIHHLQISLRSNLKFLNTDDAMSLNSRKSGLRIEERHLSIVV